jgi:hypothetical protein
VSAWSGRRAFQISRRYRISKTEKIVNLKKDAVMKALKVASGNRSEVHVSSAELVWYQ